MLEKALTEYWQVRHSDVLHFLLPLSSVGSGIIIVPFSALVPEYTVSEKNFLEKLRVTFFFVRVAFTSFCQVCLLDLSHCGITTHTQCSVWISYEHLIPTGSVLLWLVRPPLTSKVCNFKRRHLSLLSKSLRQQIGNESTRLAIHALSPAPPCLKLIHVYESLPWTFADVCHLNHFTDSLLYGGGYCLTLLSSYSCSRKSVWVDPPWWQER
mmetsp:Transcript_11271/g.23309  ORF Transcript_11271/g.23309 Transcript_11271/m.23309 type:complete len:211 (-) Transcript_11271:71-703(-)